MISIAIVYFSYFYSLSIYLFKSKRHKILPFLILFLAILFKDEYISDYDNYIESFEFIGRSADYFEKEVSFKYISLFILNNGWGINALFVIYALICLPIKCFAINKIAFNKKATFLFYCSTSFILHDLVQTRAGTSIAFFYLFIFYTINNERAKKIICMILAFIFHYSAALVFPLLLLDYKEINVRRYKICLYASVIFAIIGSSFLSIIQYIPILQPYYDTYVIGQALGNWDSLSLLAPLPIVRFIICIILLKHASYLKRFSPFFIILLKIYIIGLISYFILFSSSTIALRVSEYYQSIEIFLLPFLVMLVRNGKQRKLATAILSIIFLSFYSIRYLLTYIISK